MFLTRVASMIYDAALAVVYPQSCVICGASVESRRWGTACERCWEGTRTFLPTESLCWKCGVPSPGAIQQNPEQVTCRRCVLEPFSVARACGVYEGALRATILGLKREPYLPPYLIELLFETQMCSPLQRATLIIPVPLHAERERVRGFNQALVIARELSCLTGIPLAERALVRNISTNRHRAGMDDKARRQTVANAFQVEYPAIISGECILLVDDVFTTGATAAACAVVLLAAGAKEVLVLTIARPLFVPR